MITYVFNSYVYSNANKHVLNDNLEFEFVKNKVEKTVYSENLSYIYHFLTLHFPPP